MFEPCNSVPSAPGFAGGGLESTDLPSCRREAVTAFQSSLALMGLDKLISRINANPKSVNPDQLARVTSGSGRGSCQEN